MRLRFAGKNNNNNNNHEISLGKLHLSAGQGSPLLHASAEFCVNSIIPFSASGLEGFIVESKASAGGHSRFYTFIRPPIQITKSKSRRDK